MPAILKPSPPKLKFALGVFLLGGVCLHAVLFWTARRQVVEGYPDFSIFYTAGLIVRRGEAAHLYDNQLQKETQREFAPGPVGKLGLLPYNHPPFEALLYAPLSYESYLAAYWLWLMVNVLVLAGILRALRPRLPALFSVVPWAPYFAALGFFPIAFSLLQGQDSVLLLALYCLTFLAFCDGKDFRAGAALGLGLFKFHLVLPFAFVLLLRRRWRAMAGFAATGAGLGAISLALVGWKELLYYPHYVWWINQHEPIRIIVPSNMANLRGLIGGWNGGTALPMWGNGVIVALSLGLAIWAAVQWDAADRGNEQAWLGGFSLCMVVTFLLSYHSYNQDMSILFLPLLLLGDQLLGGKIEGRRRQRIFWACLALLFCTPVYLVLTLRFQHQNLFALGLLALAGHLAGWGRKARDARSLATAS